jgi:hypothetical protein
MLQTRSTLTNLISREEKRRRGEDDDGADDQKLRCRTEQMQATWLCGREKSWYGLVSLPAIPDQSEPAKKIRFFSWRQRVTVQQKMQRNKKKTQSANWLNLITRL